MTYDYERFGIISKLDAHHIAYVLHDQKIFSQANLQTLLKPVHIQTTWLVFVHRIQKIGNIKLIVWDITFVNLVLQPSQVTFFRIYYIKYLAVLS